MSEQPHGHPAPDDEPPPPQDAPAAGGTDITENSDAAGTAAS